LRDSVLDGYRAFLSASTPREALEAFDAFRILTPLREGPYGVGNLNRLAERVLSEAGLIAPDHAYYAGRPVLILRNDPALGLFNGDIGIIRPDEDGALRAFFADDAGGVRRFAPARLPEHETAFAMTVHKSQGSEFGAVLIILPDSDSPILSRELLYTAITRARNSVALWWSEAAIVATLARRVTRWSGLVEQLA
jgi:exodeoxyribonuclease V alpha subunit